MVAGCTPICALIVRTSDPLAGFLAAQLRIAGAQDRHQLGVLVRLNVRTAAHPNDRLPLLAGWMTCRWCALQRLPFPL
jgi:hypothetical protein